MASIRDIARKARVSIGTVDRVLHNRGRVSKGTRARVKRIIKKSGYKPNIYARNLSLSRIFTIGVLMPKTSQDSGYWRLPARGIARAQRDLRTYGVRVRRFHFDRYSEKSFERAARLCVASKPDGVLIAPVLSIVAQRLMPVLFSHLPFVFFDSTVPDTDSLSAIVQDPFQSGVLAAGLMRKTITPPGTVAMVKVLPEDFHINERIRGFESVFSSEPGIRLRLYEADSKNLDLLEQSLPDQVFREVDDVLGVFVSNAWTHPFAHSVSPGKKVCIVGYDLIKENVEFLRTGTIDFLISQRPEMQGYLGVTALFRALALRERIRKKIMLPLDILTKDNITYYQDEQQVRP